MQANLRTGNLREDCVSEATAIIASDGLDRLSLREVARRLGVSHQAPYKHFPSRDHLLAEVIRQAYDDFARTLDRSLPGASPDADLRAMGEAYVRYALEHPLQYRLMFGTTLPDPALHRDMMSSAAHAFGLLHRALERRDAAGSAAPRNVDVDALFIWSTLHGLATILASNVAHELGVPSSFRASSVAAVLNRIADALAAGDERRDAQPSTPT